MGRQVVLPNEPKLGEDEVHKERGVGHWETFGRITCAVGPRKEFGVKDRRTTGGLARNRGLYRGCFGAIGLSSIDSLDSN